jgi:portal protein
MTIAERVSAFLSPPRKAEIAVVEEKAGLGPGAYVMEYHEPLARHQRDPQKFMKYAQTISRKNPWVNTAEGIICGKASTVPWHLEDANGDTVEDTTALAVLERPNPMMTRSKLWNITLRHMGVCGNAFWFLDQRDGLAGTPLEIYYINPARMRPSTDKKGNLTGWVLDAEDTYEFEAGRQTGIPLEVGEVIHFTLEPPDWGYLGHGLIEAAENLLALNGAAERYLTQVLATGGRRGHFIGPKDGRMDDDVFQALVAGLRNVAESPDAAKRNIVTKGPIETTPQAVTPNEVGAMGVLTEMRENIVSGVWRVPLGQLGIPLPAGLNSGEARKYEEAALWQNAIEPRLRTFSETLQFQLLDRWKVLGQPVDIILELPTFDDNMPAWDILAKSEKAPVTWNEQRALVGLDPLPDYDAQGAPLGTRITMPVTLTEVAAGPDENGGFGTPVVTKPEQALLTAGPQKASLLGDLRTSLEKTVTPKVEKAIAVFLAEQRTELAKRVADKAEQIRRKPGDVGAWWNPKFWDDKLRKLLTPLVAGIASEVGAEARSALQPAKADDDFLERVLAFVEQRTGERITGINDTTRDDILRVVRDTVAEAVEAGMSPKELAVLLGTRVSGLTTWNAERAELISRTELMNAYNDAALHSYREFEVKEVEALDGDYDDVCAARNGKVFPIDEAFGISDHPNGTLDWVPVVGKASSERIDDVTPDEVRALIAAELRAVFAEKATFGTQAGTIIQVLPSPVTPAAVTNEIYVPDHPAPVVNLTTPEVKVENVVNVPEQAAPVVNVSTPEQKAGLVQDIRIVGSPTRLTRKIATRDSGGRISEFTEQSMDAGEG